MTPREAQKLVQKEREAAERDMRAVDQFINRFSTPRLSIWQRIAKLFGRSNQS